MPFSLDTFSQLLAQFSKDLTSRISTAVLYPLLATVLAMATIVGQSLGWARVKVAWDAAQLPTQVMITAIAVLVFFVLAFVANSLQASVDRLFQGAWPGWVVRASGQREHHRARRDRRRNELADLAALYLRVQQAQRDLARWDAAPAPRVYAVRTSRAVPQAHVLTATDLLVARVQEAPAHGFATVADAQGWLTPVALPEGVTLDRRTLLQLTDGTGDQLIPLTLPAVAAPAGLAPGDWVRLYTARPGRGLADQELLVAAVTPLTQHGASGAQADLLQLMLVAHADRAAALAAAAGTEPRVGLVLTTAQPPPQPTTAPDPAPEGTPTGQLPLLSAAEFRDRIEQAGAATDVLLRRLAVYWDAAATTQITTYLADLDQTVRHYPDASATAKDDYRLYQATAAARSVLLVQLSRLHDALLYEQSRRKSSLYQFYAAPEPAIAPTVVGNIFQTVDTYCDRLYGLDVSLVLPRLQSVMSEATRDPLAHAYDGLAFLEWSVLGALGVAGLGTLVALGTRHTRLALVVWLVTTLIVALLSRGLVGAALNYAAALRQAFDRERGKVIASLGVVLTSPTSQADEKDYWTKVERWWIEGTPPGTYSISGEDPPLGQK